MQIFYISLCVYDAMQYLHAVPNLALHADRPAQKLRKLLRNRQPQPRAFVLPVRSLHLLARIEDRSRIPVGMPVTCRISPCSRTTF